MRLGDLDALLEYMSDMEVQTDKKCCTSAVKSCIKEFFPQIIADQPTIDPETLPIVQALRTVIGNLHAEIADREQHSIDQHGEIHQYRDEIRKLKHRISAYEDTCLDPQEIIELKGRMEDLSK